MSKYDFGCNFYELKTILNLDFFFIFLAFVIKLRTSSKAVYVENVQLCAFFIAL